MKHELNTTIQMIINNARIIQNYSSAKINRHRHGMSQEGGVQSNTDWGDGSPFSTTMT